MLSATVSLLSLSLELRGIQCTANPRRRNGRELLRVAELVRHEHVGPVQQRQDTGTQPPPRPGTHQGAVVHVNAEHLVQVGLDETPVRQEDAGEGEVLVDLRGPVDPPREP